MVRATRGTAAAEAMNFNVSHLKFTSDLFCLIRRQQKHLKVNLLEGKAHIIKKSGSYSQQ